MSNRRRPVLACVMALGLVLPPVLASPSATADEPTTQAEAARRLQQAAAELEDSTAAARRAGVALLEVEARLPGARQAAAEARGELDGARARAAQAAREAERAAARAAEAQARVDAASARVEEGRGQVQSLARRSYRQGPMAELRSVMDAEDPQDLVDRSTLLEQVFDSGNDTLDKLAQDRLALAATQRELARQQEESEAARREADEVAERARAAAVRADAAAAAVAALAAERAVAAAAAEQARSGDAAQYAQAQADSRALAARIRAANEERRRQAAAAAAAARAARERAAAAAAAARTAAERERARRAADAAAAAERAATSEPPPPSRGRMQWPSDGPMTSRYGFRTHPIYGDQRFHAGIDIGSGYGAPVVAAETGYVTYAGPAGGYGTLVLVSHGLIDGRDITTAYAHQSSLSVSTGDTVRRGQMVGRVGSEGNSTGPHLHFEVRRDGEPVDPLDWVSR